MIKQALKLTGSGLSIIPVGRNKIPIKKLLPMKRDEDNNPILDSKGEPERTWKPFQDCIASEDEVRAWFEKTNVQVALIGGKVSCQLEQIDFDNHNQLGCVYPEWAELVKSQFPDFDKLAVHKTPGGGYHVRYRVDTDQILPQIDLAKRPLEDGGDDLIIETRSEGHYALCPPSIGYERVQGSLLNLPVISYESHQLLHSIARSFHTAVEQKSPIETPSLQPQPRQGVQLSPGDDFIRRGDHHTLLTKHGWIMAHKSGDVEYWKRPGTSNAWSATFNALQNHPNQFYCFSTNADFEVGLYNKFAMFAVLECDRDFSKAAKVLGEMGFGEPVRTKNEKFKPTEELILSAKVTQESSEPSETLDWIPYSDVWNAERFLESYGEIYRYCGIWKEWLRYDGKRWVPDNNGFIRLDMEKTIRELLVNIQGINGDETGLLLKHIAKSLSDRRIKAAVECLQYKLAIEPSTFDNDPYLLNCLNGTLNLKTGKLQPHNPTDFISYLAPTVYIPNAKSELWENTLKMILPNKATYHFVQTAVGYSATGFAKEEVLLFAFGPTATGKSTFLSAIQHVLGDYAASADFETLLGQAKDHAGGRPKTELARLRGKRFVVSSEVGSGTKLAEGIVKWITGQDKVVARFLYGKEFEFLPSFTLWLAANHQPQISHDDDAIWRRIAQVPFDQQIPKADRDLSLKEKLRQPNNASAILKWIVDGVLEWNKKGLIIPEQVEKATEAYRADMNPLNDFLDDCCIIGQEYITNPTMLWEAYLGWVEKNGIKFSLRRREFWSSLQSSGFIRGNGRIGGKMQRFYRGIGLMDEEHK